MPTRTTPGRLRPILGLAALLAAGGCGPTAYKITPIPIDRTLKESVVLDEGGLAPPKIALVDVQGIILNRSKPSLFGEGENPVSLFVEQLDKAAGDPAVRALIVRINSPGGAVTASDIIHAELKRFRARTGRPVTAVMMDVAASGGYYLACAADEIVAHPTTVTGSIGVIMQMVSFAGTLSKIGVETDAVTSGRMKAAGSPLKPLKPEERALFQEMVDRYYDRFVQVVAEGRPRLSEERIRGLADGRVYTAQQALEAGLIDRIGTLRSAVADLKERLGLARVRVVAYDRPTGFKPNVYAAEPNAPPQVNLVNIQVPEAFLPPAPEFLYLWAPGR